MRCWPQFCCMALLRRTSLIEDVCVVAHQVLLLLCIGVLLCCPSYSASPGEVHNVCSCSNRIAEIFTCPCAVPPIQNSSHGPFCFRVWLYFVRDVPTPTSLLSYYISSLRERELVFLLLIVFTLLLLQCHIRKWKLCFVVSAMHCYISFFDAADFAVDIYRAVWRFLSFVVFECTKKGHFPCLTFPKVIKQICFWRCTPFLEHFVFISFRILLNALPSIHHSSVRVWLFCSFLLTWEGE